MEILPHPRRKTTRGDDETGTLKKKKTIYEKKKSKAPRDIFLYTYIYKCARPIHSFGFRSLERTRGDKSEEIGRRREPPCRQEVRGEKIARNGAHDGEYEKRKKRNNISIRSESVQHTCDRRRRPNSSCVYVYMRLREKRYRKKEFEEPPANWAWRNSRWLHVYIYT